MPICECGHQAKQHSAVVVVGGVETLPCQTCECTEYVKQSEE